MGWRVFAAASLGFAHRDAGQPCQDAFASAVSGPVLVAAVCDGAGSQPCSDIGAARISAELVDVLAGAFGECAMPETVGAEAFHSAVSAAITTARDAVQAQAARDQRQLGHYASTLVGVVASPQGGWFFHVGDGLGIADGAEQLPRVSLPENGEYANETYFVTGEDWASHLRITPLPAGCTRIALMSDGAMPFVMARGLQGFFAPFMDPVTRFLDACTSEAEGSAGLAATLGDPRTEAITGDDKTLLIARWA